MSAFKLVSSRFLARLSLWLLAISLVIPAAPIHSAGEAPSVAFAARIVGDANRVRLVMDFDRPVAHRLRFLREPRRLTIELPHAVLGIADRERKPRSDLVDAARFEARTGMMRLVFDLAAPVSVARESFTQVDDNRHRLIVDLRRSDARAYDALVRRTSALAALRTTSPAKGGVGRAGRRTIVLDPGHGGVDGGAVGRGRTVEKELVLAFSLELRRLLRERGTYDVVMTREDDRFVQLADRVALAREKGADLLLSIHADSLPQRSIRGGTIYTLNEEGSDDLARGLADAQNRADLLAGIPAPKLGQAAGDILFDLMHRETRTFSTKMAATLVSHLKPVTRLMRKPQRSGNFLVLKAPDVPSVLLELGYLSNRRDERLMTTEAWRKKTAAAVADAITTYLDERVARR